VGPESHGATLPSRHWGTGHSAVLDRRPFWADIAPVAGREPASGRHVIQSWSRAAVALAIVAAGATGGRHTPLVRTAQAARCSDHTTFSFTRAADVKPAGRHSDAVKAARRAGADDALPARHRKLRRKRFRQRFGALTVSTSRCTELPVADIVGTLPGANLDNLTPYCDHARAPPASNQHA
jgi:hypothetical protein